MQWPDIVSPSEAAIGFIGERKTSLVVQLCNDRVQGWIDPVDAFEVIEHDLARREITGANQLSQRYGRPEGLRYRAFFFHNSHARL